VLLIHGFASNSTVNWRNTNWIRTLTNAGFRVIALDNRGHGQSEKLYDPELYPAPIMAEDARRLLDHLQIERADMVGFSMGARISAFLTINHPQRVRCVTFGGMGINLVNGIGGSDEIAAALEAPNGEDILDADIRSYRVFAEQTNGDLRALAACIRSSREKIHAEQLAQIKCPALVAVGTEDHVAGSGQALADLIPGAEHLVIPGRDHMKSVGDLAHKKGVADFLSRRP
ncbi:MAG: alpha/beta hydrolase, partial [Hyphomicrobiales bacterium]|nr:alpha/beta hydrolase [Hyphomicrobiales bacterium]